MPDPNDVVIDPWTPLDYKAAFGSPKQGFLGGPLKNAPWLSSRDRRRLSAYLVLHGYANNTARRFLPSTNARRDEVREYGDPSLIIEQALSAVLGEQQQIVVEGADEDTEDTDESVENRAEIELAADWQERLRDWATAEQMELKVLSCERNTVSLGDGVYVMFWDAEKKRPRLQSWDPGFYFPVLPDDDRTEDYPTRVHFVWEVPPEETGDRVGRLVRLTYEVKRIEPIFEEEPFGEVFLREGDRLQEGLIVRDYPWEEEPSEYACYMTQREWRLSDVGNLPNRVGVDALDLGKSTVSVRSDGVALDNVDLGIDFLPVIHVPNVYLGQEHFGQSILTKAGQVLDDLQQADTDAARASATTGSPILAASGVGMPQSNVKESRRPGGPSTGTVPVTPDTYLQIRPGMVMILGEKGQLSTVDTSANLRAMAERVDALRARTTENVRIPAVALGIIGEDSNQMSGIAIELRYAPMQSLIRSMRSVRKVKYALLLKFAQRFLMASDEWNGPSQTVDAEYQFGGFMPKNLQAVLKDVGEAYAKGVLSLETSVQMMVAAGIPIEDVMEEVKRIDSRSFEKAVRLVDALGDTGEAYDFLGRERPTIQLGAPVPPTDLPATGARPPASTPPTPAPEPGAGGEE